MSTWVVNASPLILLGKIGRLGLLTALPERLMVPFAVEEEIAAGPHDDPARAWVAGPGKEFVVPAVNHDPRIVAWDLGRGETAVLSHAIAGKDRICLLDDRAARDCAAVFNLHVIGSVGILLRAKRAGLLPAVQPEITALLRAGALLSDTVVQECLHLAGEQSNARR